MMTVLVYQVKSPTICKRYVVYEKSNACNAMLCMKLHNFLLK